MIRNKSRKTTKTTAAMHDYGGNLSSRSFREDMRTEYECDRAVSCTDSRQHYASGTAQGSSPTFVQVLCCAATAVS